MKEKPGQAKKMFCKLYSWKFLWFVVSFFHLKLLIMIKLLGYAYVMRLEAEFKCYGDYLSLYKQEKYYCFDNSSFLFFVTAIASQKRAC